MSSSPALPGLADLARQRAEDAQYYREVLHRLIAMGTDLAGAIHRQATAEHPVEPGAGPERERARAPAAPTVPDLAAAFDRVARAIRRTIMLAREISEPDRVPPGPENRADGRRLPACGHSVRGAEDVIRHRPRPRHGGAEPLSPEFLDHLDAPDGGDDPDEFGDDLGEKPLAGFIADICRDLGRAVPPGTPIWKPRTSQDVWDLCVRAAQLTATESQAAEPAPRVPDPAPPKASGAGTRTGPPEP